MEKTLGERLREERERLSLNQNEMADAGGVKRNSQGNYERGRQNPDTAYLLAIAAAGADVNYILFGQRDVCAGELLVDEAKILELYRSLSESDKFMVTRMASSLNAFKARLDEVDQKAG
ncbi:helix-turn-helix domain-containing protein [Pseudomonas sp. UBA4194]|uniref:helix-turn-helix domain-containing protein n=1 Tax=Pseudomonas sp. UBA4194 TaxID=1947317 RepID=UPI0025DFF7E9|nr:helix-turn-helix domain-containing protein [Pseudomonas sp. UBA4194]